MLAIAGQPLGLVTITEYVPESETEIVCVFSPVDQLNILPGFPASSVVENPAQIKAGKRFITGTGFTVTVTASEAVQPFEFVPMTE